MAQFPGKGERPYGSKVKNYIDETVGDARNGVAGVVREAQIAGEVATAQARLAALLAGGKSGVVNPVALAPWYAALVTENVAAKVVMVGDSITDGGLASTYAKTAPMRLQTHLRSEISKTGGIGYVSATHSVAGAIVPAVPNTRKGSARMWEHGLGGRAMMLGAADDHVTYNAQPCTKVRVYYGKGNLATAGLKVSIDGVDQGVVLSSIQPSGGAAFSGGYVWESPALTPGNHVVKVTPSNSPYVGILEGVEFINGDESSGVRVYNAAHSGGSVAAFNQSMMDLHWQSVATVDPDLVIVNLGTNDIAAVSVESFLTGMDTMLAKVPDVPVLLVGNYLRGDYNTESGRAKWQQMQDGLRARATGRIAYVDLAPHWPTLVADGSTSAGLMFDTPPIHPNDTGMDAIATVLTNALTPGLDTALRGPEGPKGEPGDLTPASQTILNTAVQDAENARDEAEAAAQAAADLLVSSSSLTLSAADPVVPALSNVNEWTVSNAVQVVLPQVTPGSQYTVHVKSGFQNITWPNGTTVYGETDQQDVWVTLIRGDAGWNVLIPSPSLTGGSGAGLDTGWVDWINCAWFNGNLVASVGAEHLRPGWDEPIAGAVLDTKRVYVRRIGNVMHVAMDNIAAGGATGGRPMFALPAEISLASGPSSVTVLLPEGAEWGAGISIRACQVEAVVGGYQLKLASSDYEQGMVFGRGTGSNPYGWAVFSFPIAPTSIWGT